MPTVAVPPLLAITEFPTRTLAPEPDALRPLVALLDIAQSLMIRVEPGPMLTAKAPMKLCSKLTLSRTATSDATSGLRDRNAAAARTGSIIVLNGI